ncbi:hypothetical protein EDF42_2131 [Curtobacterium sp. PhB172]|uniref:hypothetical protein n=1 Tax=Curtobacterium sp. PhB172 TaxID=2485196 RepID=UPI000F4C24F0|nr:hypothetical protein [Curtobacterium sp. PhB172]ROS63877.1 hypothetical protein EDF42_2131 [Curtobacterium sp. PhB172]
MTWILPSIIFAASVFAVLTARVLLTAEGKPDPAWTPWLVVATVLSALAVVFDRIADAYDKKLSKLRLSGSEDSAENSITDLNTFLGEVIEVTFLQGAAKAAHMRWLRRSLVLVAAKSIGPGSRATYYTLEDSTPGHRVLGSPQHATEYGRHDKPSRPFLEEEDPGHSIWQLLDGPDEQVEVMREGVDEVYGVDWGRKPYSTFLSVPVKAGDVQFGLLSVNCANEGAIGGSQRAAVLAMARAMATALAFDQGPQGMNSRASSKDLSVASSNVADTTETGTDHEQN